MSGRLSSYRDLLVWQRGMVLCEKVYFLTRTFPRDEQFGLISQARRAAVSVPANIAEGYGRGTKAAYINFLRIARGSLLELETHLLLAERVRLADVEDVAVLLSDVEELGRMLHTLIAKVHSAPPLR